MITKLEAIRKAVEAHFETWDAMCSGVEVTKITRESIYIQHAAMTMLRDLLPLLDAEADYKLAFDRGDHDLCENISDTILTEVSKLLEESADDHR